MRRRALCKVFFLFFAVALSLLVFVGPQKAMASNDTQVYLYINGYYLSDTYGLYYVCTSDTEGYVTTDSSVDWNARYIPSSGRLILRNYRGSKIVCLPAHTKDNFEIMLQGDNVITVNSSSSEDTVGIQVSSNNVKTLIYGNNNDTLTINVYNTIAPCYGIRCCASGSSDEGVYVQGTANVKITAAGKCGFGIWAGGTVGVLEQASVDITAKYNENASSDFNAAVYSKTGNLDFSTTGSVSIESVARDAYQHSGYGYAFYSGSDSGRLNCSPKNFPYVSLSAVGYHAKVSNRSTVLDSTYYNLEKTVKQTGVTEGLLLQYTTSDSIPIAGAIFPDPSFRSYVRNKYDTNSDGKFSESERLYIKTITVGDDTDSLLYNDAYSLVGIERFTNLTKLTWDPDANDLGAALGNLLELDLCSNKELKSVTVRNTRLRELYISDLTKLTWLDCSKNALHGPTLSGLTALTDLLLYDNLLTNIDVSAIPNLSYLDVGGNVLQTLDVSGNTQLQFLYCENNNLGSLDISTCPALTCLACEYNQLTELDISMCPILVQSFTKGDYYDEGSVQRWIYVNDEINAELSCDKSVLIQIEAPDSIAVDSINFPDEIFRNFVQETFDKNGDWRLSRAEIEAIEEINVDSKSIGSLTGIEYFYALQRLHCASNQITSIDLSGCPSLTELDCCNNQLTILDVSMLSNLTQLNCANNQLTELDLSGCPDLTGLFCGTNQLPTLDLSKCPELIELNCDSNQLTELDVSGCPGLRMLKCQDNQLLELDIIKCYFLRSVFANGEYHDYGTYHEWVIVIDEFTSWLWCDKNVDIIPEPITQYTVSFVNYDGTILQTGHCKAGDLPVYEGETPVKEDELFHIYTFCGWDPEITAVTGDVVYTAQFEDVLYAQITGMSLALEGKLGIIFWMRAPEEAATAVITFNGNEVSYELDRTSSLFKPTSEQFRLPYSNVAMKEVMDPATIRVYDADGEQLALVHNSKGLLEGGEWSFRVADWAYTILETSDNINSIGMAKALLNLGNAAQNYFNYNMENPANPDAYLREATNAVVPDPALDPVIPAGAKEKLGYKYVRLNMEGDTEIRICFSKKVTAKIGTKPLNVVKKGNEWYVSIPGIAGINLDVMNSVKVTYNNKTLTFKYSVLSFANRVIATSTDESFVYLAKALYLYNEAAEVYFDKVD